MPRPPREIGIMVAAAGTTLTTIAGEAEKRAIGREVAGIIEEASVVATIDVAWRRLMTPIHAMAREMLLIVVGANVSATIERQETGDSNATSTEAGTKSTMTGELGFPPPRFASVFVHAYCTQEFGNELFGFPAGQRIHREIRGTRTVILSLLHILRSADLCHPSPSNHRRLSMSYTNPAAKRRRKKDRRAWNLGTFHGISTNVGTGSRGGCGVS